MPDNQISSFPGTSGQIVLPAGTLTLNYEEGKARFDAGPGSGYTGPVDFNIPRFGERPGQERRAIDDPDSSEYVDQIFGTMAVITHNRAISVALNNEGTSQLDFSAEQTPAYITLGPIRELFITLTQSTTLRVECYWNLVVQKAWGTSGGTPITLDESIITPSSVIWTIDLVRSELTFLDAFGGALTAGGAVGNAILTSLRSHLRITMLTIVQRTGAPVDFDFEIWERPVGASRTEPPIVTEQYQRVLNREILTGLTDELLYLEAFLPPLEYFDRDDDAKIYVRLVNNAGGTTSIFDIVFKIGALLEG